MSKKTKGAAPNKTAAPRKRKSAGGEPGVKATKQLQEFEEKKNDTGVFENAALAFAFAEKKMKGLEKGQPFNVEIFSMADGKVCAHFTG